MSLEPLHECLGAVRNELNRLEVNTLESESGKKYAAIKHAQKAYEEFRTSRVIQNLEKAFE